MINQFLEVYSKESITPFISSRKGETKLGEALKFPKLDKFKGKYVIIGIPEDIGPRANLGNGGAQNAWNAFLSSFLNTQSNHFINTSNFLLLGHIKLQHLKNETTNINELRTEVEKIDEIVYPIIQKIKALNKIPIIIGGGHNNAYPIIKGVSLALQKPLNVLNIDPHADLREIEGRHSGNGFSYALNQDYLNRYFIAGLHQNYNSSYILNKIEAHKNIQYITYDKILQENKGLSNYTKVPLNFLKDYIGLEIDLDSIADFPVSAKTPSGISVEELRKTLFQLKKQVNFEYIHICEGAPTNPDENRTVGKTLSYLVTDLIKD